MFSTCSGPSKVVSIKQLFSKYLLATFSKRNNKVEFQLNIQSQISLHFAKNEAPMQSSWALILPPDHSKRIQLKEKIKVIFISLNCHI